MTDFLLENAKSHMLAARLMYDNISSIYDEVLDKNELYKTAAGVIYDELIHIPVSAELGVCTKKKSCRFTPVGLVPNFTDDLDSAAKTYIFHAPAGIESSRILKIFSESALCRGFDITAYYCTMRPSDKIEHLIIPNLKLAMVTSNKFHRINRAQLTGEVVDIDMTTMFSMDKIRFAVDIVAESLDIMERLINASCQCLATAKKETSKSDVLGRTNTNAFTICR